MPSGPPIKPGDIIRSSNGKTVEVNNTDAEGRLILADGLACAAAEGAERIVDLATLTGAIVIALGSTYAGLISNDDELAAELARAGDEHRRAGLAPAAAPRVQGADPREGRRPHATSRRRARRARSTPPPSSRSSSTASTWAHLDIAGAAWDDDREYVGKGATGLGVRLLVELAPRGLVLRLARPPWTSTSATSSS